MNRLAGTLALCFSMTLAVTAAAETLQAGKEYAGGTKIDVEQVGISFKLPAGTSGGQPPGSEFLMIGRGTEMGKVFMWVANKSPQEMAAIMNQMIMIDIGVQMVPNGQAKVSGNTVTNTYNATDGTGQFQGHIKTTVKNGVAVAVISVAPADALPSWKALGEKVTASLKFGVKPKKPKTPKGGSTGSGTWAEALKNMNLIRFSHGSGYSEKETYSLCANGRYYHHFNASSSSVNGTGVADSNNQGRWTAKGNQLTMTSDAGSSFTVTLNLTDNKLFIEGTRWYREATQCQ